MKKNAHWYFEGVEKGHLFIVEKSDKRKPEIRVTIYPRLEKKRKMFTEPEIHKIAEKAAGKSGCPEYEYHNYKRWDGIFEYKAATPKGKKCRFILGGYTGRIIRVK